MFQIKFININKNNNNNNNNNQSFVLQSKKSDWLLYETQHWAEMGYRTNIKYGNISSTY